MVANSEFPVLILAADTGKRTEEAGSEGYRFSYRPDDLSSSRHRPTDLLLEHLRRVPRMAVESAEWMRWNG